MFFRGIGIEAVKVFIEVTAGFRHFFQCLAAFAQQADQVCQFRAVAGINSGVLNMPLQVNCHFFRRHTVNVVVIEPL